MQVLAKQTVTETTFEASLSQVEESAEKAITAAKSLLASVTKLRQAARTGDVKALQKTSDAVQATLEKTRQTLESLHDDWTWSESKQDAHLQPDRYSQELLAAAHSLGVSLFEQDGHFACYPSLVKLQPKDRSILIDRKVYRNLRPSYLAAHLAKLQKRAPKLNAATFLETLKAAHGLLNGGKAGMQKLLDIYEVLTVMPTAKKDYSLQEFARDVYLLDGSGLKTTKDGNAFHLDSGSTGGKKRANLLIVITRDGLERTYYGIEFFSGER
ncbi:MAG: hypothetical protein ACYCW6_06775 [Candidatus Xenobia bacterium]